MKNTTQYIFLFALLLFSCKKEPAVVIVPPTPLVIEPDYPVNDKYTVLNAPTIDLLMRLPVENKIYKWKANISAAYIPADSSVFGLSIYTFYKYDSTQPRECLLPGDIPLQVGKYPLTGPYQKGKIYGLFFRQVDDGAIDGDYEIDNDEKSWIEVTSVDWKNHKVAGNFDLHFKISQPSSLPYPEKVHFYHAPFDVKVFKAPW